MKDYRDKKVLVVGLARSGVAAASYLVRQGASVTVTDTRRRSELESEIGALESSLKDLNTIKYHLGSNPAPLFAESDLVVVSPGVPLEIEGVRLAMKKKIPVICELELGISRLKGRLVAITGTNGKSTTTALAGELLKGAGKNVWVGGNIGRPLIGHIDEAKGADYVVLELSSYQLETTPSLRAHVAVWLNVTPDHLDRYASFDQYVAAKELLGRNQKGDDWIIFNQDDPLVSRRVALFKSQKLPFSPSSKLDSGAWYEGGRLRVKGQGSRAGGGEFDFSIDTSVSKLMGIHNRENIAAASLVAALFGLSGREIGKSLARFKGLPHRLQFVRELNGVSYFDDSKGTNVGATVRSVESFDSPIVLIAGGQDKNTGYQGLRSVVAGSVRCILAIGSAAEKIGDELGDVVDVIICESLPRAVEVAADKSVPGDVVLLSPACASFDMFKDYAHRGEVFIDCVNSLG